MKKFFRKSFKLEFRGKVHLKNIRDNSKFKAFLTDKERLELFSFISGLRTDDRIDFEYFEK
jgi:hypothetical protein